MKWLPWAIIAALVLSGGIGTSCGRAALKRSQERADSAIAGQALDSARAEQAESGKRQALAERDSATAQALLTSAEAARLRRRNVAAAAALPPLPDTCKPALLLIDSLRVEADSQARAAAHWQAAHVKDSTATVRADEATAAQTHRAEGLERSLIDLRRVSARDPEKWIFGIRRPQVVLGAGIQAGPTGRMTSGAQITVGIPIF